MAAARNLSSSSDADCEYGQISATTGDKVFTIRSGLKPRASHGYNRTQRTSGSLVRVGEAKTNYSGYPYDTIREIRKTVDFSLTGWGLAQYTPPITVGTSACPGTIEALLSFATPDEAFFSAALSAGTYILCSDGDLVARLAVTGRAAAGVWAAAARNHTDNPYLLLFLPCFRQRKIWIFRRCCLTLDDVPVCSKIYCTTFSRSMTIDDI